MNDVTKHMFGDIHPEAFSLFARASRTFYAELLEYLSEDIFLDAGYVTKSDTIDGIKTFIKSHPKVSETISRDTESASWPYQVYSRLLETGWLVEQQTDLTRVTDFDPSARLLLDFLLDLKSGRLRSYGTEVIQVLSSLESAHRDPEERSAGLRAAAKASKGFLNHLRGLSAGMRKAEQAISSHKDFDALFETFFTDYVQRYLVEDFKLIKTKANPFRFRVSILKIANDILEDDVQIDVLSKGYLREAGAKNADQARKQIISDIRQVLRVFENLDSYLQIIDETNARVELKIRNTVRFLDQIAEANTDALERVMETLGGLEIDEIATPAPDSTYIVPIGNMHLFMPPEQKPEIAPHEIRKPEKSEAMIAYEQSLLAYKQRVMSNPDKIASYLEEHVGDKHELMGDELPLDTLDDFIIFERIRSQGFVATSVLRSKWATEIVPGRIKNDWISCRKFKVVRKDRAGRS